MNTPDIERLHELKEMSHKISRSLKRKAFQIPDLMPGVLEAESHADRLEKWLDELVWIADTELRPRR